MGFLVELDGFLMWQAIVGMTNPDETAGNIVILFMIGFVAVTIVAAVLSYMLNNKYIAAVLTVLVYGIFLISGFDGIFQGQASVYHKITEALLYFVTSMAGLIFFQKVVSSLWPDIVIGGVVRGKEPLFVAKLWYGILNLLAPTAGGVLLGFASLSWYTTKFSIPMPNIIFLILSRIMRAYPVNTHTHYI
jgi:hypothetical protein